MLPTADATALGFTQTEDQALYALRQRYREQPDLFSDRELAHLLFLRWLHRTDHSQRSMDS